MLSRLFLLLLIALPGCGGESDRVGAPPMIDESDEPLTPMTLEQALSSPWRVAPHRDEFRHPLQTLNFFGVRNSDTVIEIWPGGGWYSSILVPWLHSGGGRYIAAGFDPERSNFARKATTAWKETFLTRPDVFGTPELTILSKDSIGLGVEGEADIVLTFRNVHNWLSGGYADKVFTDSFAALKPGGVLGLVEHRLPSSAEQLPGAPTGYVHEELIIRMARNAGFELEAKSSINANPKDTADHPFGVWTLPPVLRMSPRSSDGEAATPLDPEKFIEIGESDRVTLRFRKPG